MKEQDDTKKELLATIERRFQFVVILALFLPFVGDNALKISTTLSQLLAGDWSSFIYPIISYIFLSYFLLEIFRKSIKENFLVYMGGLLLALSYSLIVFISFASITKGTELFGWKLILFDLSLLGNLFIPVFVLALPVIGLINDGVRRFSKKLK